MVPLAEMVDTVSMCWNSSVRWYVLYVGGPGGGFKDLIFSPLFGEKLPF